MYSLTVGCLAYLDSFYGLVPCRVLSIVGKSGMANTGQHITVRLTASRQAYKRGETIESNALHVVPRRAVCVRCGQYRIRGYNVQP